MLTWSVVTPCTICFLRSVSVLTCILEDTIFSCLITVLRCIKCPLSFVHCLNLFNCIELYCLLKPCSQLPIRLISTQLSRWYSENVQNLATAKKLDRDNNNKMSRVESDQALWTGLYAMAAVILMCVCCIYIKDYLLTYLFIFVSSKASNAFCLTLFCEANIYLLRYKRS